jgi:hypothetical protein
MDYKMHIGELERHQKTPDRLMHLQLNNIIIGIGKNSEIEAFKQQLRIIYKEFKTTKNPYSWKDGSVIDKKSLDKIQELIIKIIDLLNDHYGNFKLYEK